MKNVIAHITMPESMVGRLLTLARELMEAAPDIVGIRIEDAPEAQRTVQASAAEPVTAQVEDAREPWERALFGDGAQQVDKFEGRRKLYRVINPNLHMTGQPEEIKVYLLAHGPQSARTLEQVLDMKRKSVESALTTLRAVKCVESYVP